MRLRHPETLAFGVLLIVASTVKVVAFGGDASTGAALIAGGALWSAGAFRPERVVPERWWPSKDPDDYR